MQDTIESRIQDGPQIAFRQVPEGRIYRLREQYWAGTAAVRRRCSSLFPRSI